MLSLYNNGFPIVLLANVNSAIAPTPYGKTSKRKVYIVFSYDQPKRRYELNVLRGGDRERLMDHHGTSL